MDHLDDEEIKRLYSARDERAIEETKQCYGRYILSIAYNILNNNEDALECENDVYLKLWNTVSDKCSADLKTHISVVTRSRAISMLRERNALKRGAGEPENIPVPIDDIAELLPDETVDNEIIEKDELKSLINSFLSALPTEERTAFIKRYWFAEPVKTVAEEMDISQSKAKILLMRTRNKLKQHLKGKGVVI